MATSTPSPCFESVVFKEELVLEQAGGPCRSDFFHMVKELWLPSQPSQMLSLGDSASLTPSCGSEPRGWGVAGRPREPHPSKVEEACLHPLHSRCVGNAIPLPAGPLLASQATPCGGPWPEEMNRCLEARSTGSPLLGGRVEGAVSTGICNIRPHKKPPWSQAQLSKIDGCVP